MNLIHVCFSHWCGMMPWLFGFYDSWPFCNIAVMFIAKHFNYNFSTPDHRNWVTVVFSSLMHVMNEAAMLPLLMSEITQRENDRWMGRTQCHKLYLQPSPFCHGHHFSLMSCCTARWKLTNMIYSQLSCAHTRTMSLKYLADIILPIVLCENHDLMLYVSGSQTLNLRLSWCKKNLRPPPRIYKNKLWFCSFKNNY